MTPPRLTRELILTLLAQTPVRMNEVTRDLAENDLTRRVQEAEWSVVDILAHLRLSADVRGSQRIERMLSDNEPTIPTQRPRDWQLAEPYARLRFDESYAAYAHQRARLVERLEGLSSDAWLRGARLTGIGVVRRSNVHDEADALIRHELRHLRQLERTTYLLRYRLTTADRRRRILPAGPDEDLEESAQTGTSPH